MCRTAVGSRSVSFPAGAGEKAGRTVWPDLGFHSLAVAALALLAQVASRELALDEHAGGLLRFALDHLDQGLLEDDDLMPGPETPLKVISISSATRPSHSRFCCKAHCRSRASPIKWQEEERDWPLLLGRFRTLSDCRALRLRSVSPKRHSRLHGVRSTLSPFRRG